jgi:putative FmdB family regulatory protein
MVIGIIFASRRNAMILDIVIKNNIINRQIISRSKTGVCAMPVYEYECDKCEKVFEVQQKISDDPLTQCPICQSPVKKLMSMSSFQLKGGGWYADGYASKSSAAKPTTPAASPPCQSGGSCANCPASASAAS